MSKAQFSNADIQSAVDAFVSTNVPRIAPAVGKNSDVTVYGENKNPYKPVIVKEDENGTDEKISGSDIGVEFEGSDGLGDSQSV